MSSFLRQSNRLPHKNLYQNGNWYFVTICVQDKKSIFTDFVEASLSRQNHFELNQIGKIIEKEWLNLPNIFDNIILNEYVIMPNHFHGIIGFDDSPVQLNTNKTVNLGQIISRFKNNSRREIVNLINKNGETGSPLQKNDNFNHHKPWQKSFYDHVIRNEKDLQRIQEYIFNNPLNWGLDSLNPKNAKPSN